MASVTKEGYKFRQDSCIPCYHTDRNKVLRPESFMDMAQEIAYWAASELGFGYETLHIHHMAWVLSRMHLHFEIPIKWKDAVMLYTWHKGASGLFYIRDFELFTEDGKSAVQGTSSWVVIDDRTRRFIRPEDLSHFLETGPVDDAIRENAPKLMPPKDAAFEPAGSHTVAYSDLDMNLHTNNARYGALAMDALPQEVTEQPVRDFYINFNKETVPGETIELVRLQQNNAWWVEGLSDGKVCFTVKIEF